MELIRRFAPETYAAALASWLWLDGLSAMTPALTNAFGDVFLRAPDGSFAFLDTLDGTLERVWASAEDLQTAINTPEIQDQYLLIGLAIAADQAGLQPGPDQILSFTVPPVLGGHFDVENLEVADFVVATDLAGQILRQATSLAPGTPISYIERPENGGSAS